MSWKRWLTLLVVGGAINSGLIVAAKYWFGGFDSGYWAGVVGTIFSFLLLALLDNGFTITVRLR